MKAFKAAAIIIAGTGASLAALPAAALAQAIPVYAESRADALARNVKILATNPQNFTALIGAGKAALDLGDAQSAAGFFGRAEEVQPRSPLPKAGMGAALVETGDPNGALAYFALAQRLGATSASIGSDRGLAYDLLGQQVAAQTDYRAALTGPDRDEARRRLALSLAISGKKDLALSTLDPLLARRDQGAIRVRILVLALAGDVMSAKSALDYTMPGAAARMDPFFRRLPALTSGQKAAAVHLGIFPGSGVAMASRPPVGDRLASVDQLLNEPQALPADSSVSRYTYAVPAPVAQPQAPPARLASVPRPTIERAASRDNGLIDIKHVRSDSGGSKIWLQLASGPNAAELPERFERLRARKPSLFDGISGYVADAESRSRLVIGPFHSDEDARLFADALDTIRINSFKWVSKPGQVVRKISRQ